MAYLETYEADPFHDWIKHYVKSLCIEELSRCKEIINLKMRDVLHTYGAHLEPCMDGLNTTKKSLYTKKQPIEKKKLVSKEKVRCTYMESTLKSVR